MKAIDQNSKAADRALSYERRILLLSIAAGLPGVVVSVLLVWNGHYTPKVQWTLTVFVIGLWLGLVITLRERVVRPLQTLSNLLAALREGDYSIRARGAEHDNALGEVYLETNALGETLREQRLGALEATALLRTVMSEIDVAIFAFDEEGRLRLVNRAGERLMGEPSERLLGRSAGELELQEYLEGEVTRTLQTAFPGQAGRWGIQRSSFRQHGRPHHLLVVSNLSQELREEERQAWQRLIRVLGHELNNSLAPIKSIAGSLMSLILREPRPSDWQDDMEQGLSVIASRSEALSRFMGGYARLARLPQPIFRTIDIGPLLRRVVALETRMKVSLVPGPELSIQGDEDQLEQLLINVVRNAVDATLETGGGVDLIWGRGGNGLEIVVQDEGPGLSNTTNLFVPFFTTKPQGTGIGLVLSRQIAEAHGGTLTLENRRDGRGCEARLHIPILEAPSLNYENKLEKRV